VAKRPALATVRSRPVRAGRGSLPSRLLAVAGAALVGLGLLYIGARQTSVLSLRTIEVSGAPPAVAAAVRSAAQPSLGESLVGLDGEALTGRLRALPSVAAVEYDRSFPHTLRLRVTPEQPVALVRAGTQSWVVSRRGRVIRAADRLALRRLPRVWLPSATELRPGDTLADNQQSLAVRALAHVRERFPAPIVTARESEGHITLVLALKQELRLGGAGALPLKLAVAERVLETLDPAEVAELLYLDVSLPARPVAAANPQLSS
jgi:cell division septal protein FtsQ